MTLQLRCAVASPIACSPARCCAPMGARWACWRCFAPSRPPSSPRTMRVSPSCWRAASPRSSRTATTRLTGLLTRPAFEQRVTPRAAGAVPRRRIRLERALHRHQPPARDQRQLRHARGRSRHRAARRADPRPPAAGRLRRAHLRRPLRDPAAGGAARGGTVRRGAARRRRGSSAAALGDGKMQVSISIGVAAVEQRSKEFVHAFAAAETACKAANDRGRNRVELYQEADESIVRRFSRHQPDQRSARRSGRRPPAAQRAADRAARYHGAARPGAFRDPAAHDRRERRRSWGRTTSCPRRIATS